MKTKDNKTNNKAKKYKEVHYVIDCVELESSKVDKIISAMRIEENFSFYDTKIQNSDSI